MHLYAEQDCMGLALVVINSVCSMPLPQWAVELHLNIPSIPIPSLEMPDQLS